MKLIFAQGNPGDRYVTTRHNIGWRVIDEYAKKQGSSFTDKSKFSALVTECSVNGEKVLLVKPTTYYNETGRSARALIDFYKLDSTTDILAVHDELALPFGVLRTRPSGSPAGNNGIKSLNAHLGPEYWRLRIGIANDLLPRIDAHDFVLGGFAKAEAEQLSNVIEKACNIIDTFVRGDHEHTTHTLQQDA